MNGCNHVAPALALVALALLAGVVSAAEHQVTNATVDQVYAAVVDDRILWSDDRTGDYDVYLYNLTEEGERTLSPAGTDQFATALPAGMMMSGERVVWEDNRSGNRDIYLYDLTTGEETQITNGTGHEINPAIAGDWIVWQDDRNGNWDIYLYDIATGVETQITTDENVQMTPAVTESMVVWNDYRNGNWDIYAWTPDAAAPSAPSAPGPAGAPTPVIPGQGLTPGAPGVPTLPAAATPAPAAPAPGTTSATNATTTLPPGETPTPTEPGAILTWTPVTPITPGMGEIIVVPETARTLAPRDPPDDDAPPLITAGVTLPRGDLPVTVPIVSDIPPVAEPVE